MPKRSSQDAFQAVVSLSRADSGPTHKSRSGRVVKPKVWDDGTVAAPVAALKEEPVEVLEKEGDPDYSDDAVEEHLSEELAAHEYELDSDDGGYSDGPMGSYGSHGSRGRYGATRDESGKFTQGRSRGGRGKGSHRSSASGGGGGGGGIFKMAAVEVLRQEKRLLSTGEIARLALKRGLIKCSGKTPEATMASALYTDIKRREGQSIFIRPHEGLFGLREWIEQGVPFQDDYAEEMAKRARANFGYMGVIPPAVVDKEGKPLAPMAPYYPPYGAPMGVPGVDPALLPPMLPGMAGLPPLPGYSGGGGGGGKSKGRKAAAAAAAAHSGDDDDEGLMQLLNAAEELHRSSSKEGDEEWEEEEAAAHGDGAVDKPASTSEGPAAAAGEGASRRHSQGEACSSGAAAAGSEGGGAGVLLEEAGALAAMAQAGSVAPSSVPSEGGSKGDPGAEEAAGGLSREGEDGQTPDSEELADAAAVTGALAGLAGLMPTPAIGEGGPFPYYPPLPGYYNPFMAQGPARGEGESDGTQEEDDEDLDTQERARSAALCLVVTGSAKPLQLAQRAQQGGQQRVSLGGQEQVNILNLPLPDFEAGAKAAAEAPLPEVSSAQLRQAEALVMRLEGELGTSHPEVGKALLTLAKMYMAEGSPNSRQLATAAISRAQDIMTVCQVALNRQTTCGTAFAYLMDKAKVTAPPSSGPRAMDIVVAAGDAALVGLASPPPQ